MNSRLRNPSSSPNPANPAPGTGSQVGTIVVGAVAGLTVCAILTAFLAQWQSSQSAAQMQVTS